MSEPQSETGRVLPKASFPPGLPISKRVEDISEALEANQVVIVVGATGSGKTTQLPKIALQMGRGAKQLIGITQPRRIAATSVAARVAEELECTLGQAVGYQVRFDKKTSPATCLKFMTDGILLAETQNDPLLRAYDTLIIDEAHERSITIDFLLGWLKRILKKRKDLKVIVSSATIETERFSRFFDDAPVITVEGRTFPVDVLYEPPNPELDLADAVAEAVETVTSLDPRGDILVFLPGEREIRETERELLERKLRHTAIQPLYSRLSAAEQRKVFAEIGQRRVILATNVAETSLTLPGIVYVIDSGLARLARYDARTGTTRLQIEAISQASADQRKGRCGRVRDGICLRLYEEEAFDAQPAFTDPEMKRVGLSGVILRMKALGLGNVEDFPFLDLPHPRSVKEGYRVLEELGALSEEGELTALGRRLSRFPVDPRVARMILAGIEYDCLEDILVLAAALNIQDPRENPRGAEQRAEQAHQRFRDERSDFVSLLKLWDFVRELRSTGELRRACKQYFLSFSRIREWRELHRQLREVASESSPGRKGSRTQHSKTPHRPQNKAANEGDAKAEYHAALHQALLSGLLSRVGQYNAEKRVYFGSRQTRFTLHPSSALNKKPPAWVMAFELVQTTRLYARTAARIEPIWLDTVGHHLLKRKHSDPHWSERAGRSTVKEHATLFGLQVFKDRRIDYATLQPGRARLMFLDHALVRGEYESRGAFQQHNDALRAQVSRLLDKARRSDMLEDEEALLSFFDERVAESVVNGKSFESWRQIAEKKQPHLLHLAISQLLANTPDLKPEDYPEELSLAGTRLPLQYRFDPTDEQDGITLKVPLPILPQLEPGQLDWTIPAWHEAKLMALLERLPKQYRRSLAPLQPLAAALAAELTPFEGELVPQLASAIKQRALVDIPPEAFALTELPLYLRLTCEIVGPQGKVLEAGRGIQSLISKYAPQARRSRAQTPCADKWQQAGLTTWSFPDPQPYIQQRVQGVEMRLYPAIEDAGNSVKLVLMDKAEEANRASQRGLKRLLSLACSRELKALRPRLCAPFARRLGAATSTKEREMFSDQAMILVVSEAFGLTKDDGPLPTKAAFDTILAGGLAQLDAAFSGVNGVIAAINLERTNTRQALQKAAAEHSGQRAATQVQAQIEALFPVDLLSAIGLPQLSLFPRYLQAAQVRLTRAVHAPAKDAEKAEDLQLLWKTFQSKKAPDKAAASSLRWAFEEARVALFAPELKPKSRLTLRALQAAIAELR